MAYRHAPARQPYAFSSVSVGGLSTDPLTWRLRLGVDDAAVVEGVDAFIDRKSCLAASLTHETMQILHLLLCHLSRFCCHSGLRHKSRFGSNKHPLPHLYFPPNACACPAEWAEVKSLTLSPVPATASIKASSDSNIEVWVGTGFPDESLSSSSSASCNSVTECGQLSLSIAAPGVFDIVVDAPGYQEAATAVTFTLIGGGCCPFITPTSVDIALTRN